jgi:ATP-binding cassette subfamily B protein
MADAATSRNPIPVAIRELAARIVPDGAVRLAAASDLTEDGRYGERWLVATDERVLVFTLNGRRDPEVAVDLPLAEITDVEVEGLVGGAALRAVMGDRKADLISFSNAQMRRFGLVRGQLEALVKGRPVPDTPEDTQLCPNCGLYLGEYTRVCPRCVRKGAVLRRLLGYARPYRRSSIVVGVLMLAGVVVSLVPPYLTKELVDDVLTPPHKRPSLLLWLVLAYAVVIGLEAIFAVYRGRLVAWLSGRVSFDIRAQLYERLQWLSLRYYDRHPTGAIISRLSQDSTGIQDFLAFGLPSLAIDILTVVGLTAMTLILNWKLALAALLPAPIIALLGKLLWERVRSASRAYWYRWSRFHALINDALGRVRIIKAFSQQPAELVRYGGRNTDLFRASIRADQLWAIIYPVVGLLIGIGPLLVWALGGHLVLSGSMKLGALIAFLGYLGMLYWPVSTLGQLLQWMSRAVTAGERIFEVLDAESDSERLRGSHVPERIEGKIEFRNVSFGYKKHEPVLKEVCLKVQPGTMLGLVGKSGAGKSTVINLVCRFYDADQGRIFIDDIPLNDLALSAYRGRLGAVLQEPFLFSGTIAENIAYGKPEATLEEVMEAAKVANAHGFIINRPDGYDSQVGERGGSLSGGEKQRLAIARAILHDPAILILDEATASVDLETEEQIQEAITRLIEGRTTIAIAHRLSTLRNAHSLVVIEDGKVVESGTHDELEAKKGVYYDLLQIHRKTSLVEAWKE